MVRELSEPTCYARRCIHFTGVVSASGTEVDERVACTAFPKGIPDQIAYGINKHLVPLKNQGNKIVFEQSRGD